MKITVSIFLFLISFYQLYSQPVYSASDYADIDSIYVLSSVLAEDLAGNDFEGTGAGYSWDFSNLGIASQDNTSFINPDNSGYFESFIINCLAGGGGWLCYQQWEDLSNIAQPSDDTLSLGTLSFTNMVNFYTKENALTQTMIGMTFSNDGINLPLPIEFENPDTIFKFPINYLDEYDTYSSYSMSFEASGYAVEYMNHKYRSTTVEGYGDINTPFSEFNNAIKIKTTIHKVDTVIYNGTTVPLVQLDKIIYLWLHPEYGYPVFQAEGNIIGGNTYMFTKATFMDTLRCLEPSANFISIPQTAYLDSTGQAEIFFFNFSNNADAYIWNFGDNQTSSENSPSHIYTEEGTYEIKLTACNSVCDPLVCDSMNMLVEIIDTSSVSTPEISKQMINLHPNPAYNKVQIEFNQPVQTPITIELYTIQGVCIKKISVSDINNETLVDLSNLPRGIYFIKTNLGNDNTMCKVIKL